LRTQLFALAYTLVPGLLAIGDSSFKTTSLLALVPLGCLGTGIAFVTMATLMGRVGPARASIAIYFVPVVAVALGSIVRSESIAPIALLGTAMVIAGAYLTSRKHEARTPKLR
jgi:drug/metabolite transporter (DMT)-like permease